MDVPEEIFKIGILPSLWGRDLILERLKSGLPTGVSFVLIAPEEDRNTPGIRAILAGEMDLVDSAASHPIGGDFLKKWGPRVLVRENASVEQVADWINGQRVDRILLPPWEGAQLWALLQSVPRADGLWGTQMPEADLRQVDSQLASLRGTLALQKEHFLGFCFRVLHAFDPLSAARTELVVEICRSMGLSHALDPRERETLRTASWLFDIGLVSMPRSLLYRMREDPGSLEGEELDFYRHHSVIGQTLASFVDPLRSVGEVIRGHHERFDGSGFPDGLAGDRIPWAARCLGVAVAYVESGLPPLEAAEQIQEGSGVSFDPEAVRLFFQTHPVSSLPRNVREVLMADLEEGMRLAKGITTRSGMLLVPAGQELNAVSVSKLRNHARLNLVTERILVYR